MSKMSKLSKQAEYVCGKLSERYKFSKEEGLEYLRTCERKSNRRVSLPFLGKVEGNCNALRKDGGLYTQCQSEAKEGKYCVGCVKEQKYGTVDERVEKGVEWRSPDGKEPTYYGNVMEKKKITKEQAVREAAKFGWEIPEEQFQVGKPKKAAKAKKVKAEKVKTEKVKAEKAPGGKRGRPEKQKAVETSANGDDLIAQLVAQAQQIQQISTIELQKSVVETEEEEEEEEVKVPELDESVGLEEIVIDKPMKPVRQKACGPEKTKAMVVAMKMVEEIEIEIEKKKQAEKKTEKKKPAEKKTEEKTAEKKTEKKKPAEKKTEKKKPAEKKTEENVEVVDELESETLDEDEVDVIKFDHQGVKYLRDKNKVVYDVVTEDPLGTWNEATGKIMPLEDMTFDE